MGDKLKPPTLDLSVDRFSAFRSLKEKWNDYVLLTDLAAKDPEYQSIINETLERHKFFQRQQEEGESFDDFLTDIKLLVKTVIFIQQRCAMKVYYVIELLEEL